MGRFINADGLPGQVGDILSTNMFAYCANNPVMYLDSSGEIAWPIIVIIVIVAVYIVGLIVHSVGSDPESDTLYVTPDEAAIAWKNEYQSQDKEYSPILYSKEVDGITKYYYGKIYEGYSNNCIPGLFYGYTTGLIGIYFPVDSLLGLFIATRNHPKDTTMISSQNQIYG